MDPGLQINRKSALHTVFSYILAAFSGALGLLIWLTLRGFVLEFLPHSSIKKEAWRAVDNFTFVLFGILWLVLVLFSQYYYKKGFRKGRIWHHFFLITSIQLLILMASQATPIFLGWTGWNLSALLPPLIECVLGIGLIIWTVRMARKLKSGSST